MSLYNDASLVMIPSAYKDGKLYSIKPTDGSGDFTFSRGSNLAATRVDENGLIEKGRENVITYSNDFSNASWTLAGIQSITIGQSGYDGSSDASLVIPNSATQGHQIGKSTETFTGLQTYSIYAKNGGYDLQFRATGIGSTNIWVSFDLTNGVVGTSGGGQIDSSITSVGGGWYRCSMTFTTASSPYIGVYQVPDGATAGQAQVFSGDGTSGLYIQDAQVEVSLVATDYIETTTTTAQAGILEDMPRLDYSGGASCPSLLLEPTRTNLIPHSEYFESWQFISEVNLTSNTDETTSPEGVYNATKMVENTSSNPHRVFVVQTGTNNMLSFFAKAGERDWVNVLTNSGGYVYFNVSTGEKGTQASGSPTTIEDYGNGWYRCSVYNFHNTYALIGVSPSDGTLSYTGDGTSGVYIYGAQVEASASYPTSYIPCYGAATTRSADVCDLNGMNAVGVSTSNNWTYFIDVDDFEAGSNGFYLYSTSGEILHLFSASVGYRNTSNSTDYVASWSWASYNGNNSRVKMIFRYDGDKLVVFLNGVKKDEVDSSLVSSRFNDPFDRDRFHWTGLSKWNTNQKAFFDTALTDSECIALTTI